MKTFLAVVGALAILFVLAVATLFLWVRWKIRQMAERVGGNVEEMLRAAQKTSSVPPFRVRLVPVGAIEWESPEKVDELSQELHRARFADIGTFIAEPANLRLAAYWFENESAYAVIYEGPGGRIWADLATFYEDGSSVTYTTTYDTLLDRPESKLIRFCEGFGFEELLRTFLRERPHKPMVRITPAEFADRFERAYAETMDFRIAQGGPSEAEVHRIAERSQKECTPELVAAIRGRWALAIERFQRGEPDEPPQTAEPRE